MVTSTLPIIRVLLCVLVISAGSAVPWIVDRVAEQMGFLFINVNCAWGMTTEPTIAPSAAERPHSTPHEEEETPGKGHADEDVDVEAGSEMKNLRSRRP